jgi:DNA-directed RNA polymerase specialized sigma24 family protein
MAPRFPSGPVGFPDTRQSLLQRLASDEESAHDRAMDVVCTHYWKPVYRYVRLRWGLEPADAEDLTQGFFLYLLGTSALQRYDRGRARFRTYLRLCLDGYCANRHADARRLKRGGAAEMLSLDAAETAAGLGDPDVWFHREWVRELFERSIAALRERLEHSGRSVHFALFQRYDVDGPDASPRPTYAGLAGELGIPITQVTNFLALARREFRAIVLEQIRELSVDEAEFRDEARALLGWSPDDAAL